MEIQEIVVFDRKDFRKWLKKNHKKERRVKVIVYKKHTGRSAPSHRELMEEAICFGWIDTTIKRIDEERYCRNFSKRSEKSSWSDNTLGYAKELMKEGKMSDQGMKFYKLGLKKPTHDVGIPKNPDMPESLKKMLAKNKKAKEKFEEFPPSTKRMFYRWIISAKLEETKNKRIKFVVDAAIKGKKSIL